MNTNSLTHTHSKELSSQKMDNCVSRLVCVVHGVRVHARGERGTDWRCRRGSAACCSSVVLSTEPLMLHSRELLSQQRGTRHKQRERSKLLHQRTLTPSLLLPFCSLSSSCFYFLWVGFSVLVRSSSGDHFSPSLCLTIIFSYGHLGFKKRDIWSNCCISSRI